MKLLYYISALSCIITCVKSEQLCLINCSWPCPTTTQGCIVTSQGASCRDKGIDEWIINSPEKAPIYTGAYVSTPLQSCLPVPIPSLPVATAGMNTTTQIGQSIIMWPILSIRRPQDHYLGNCGHGFYCSSMREDEFNPVCRQRFSVSSACFSSNQCITGSCVDASCQYNDNRTDDGRRQRYFDRYNKDDDKKTARILASVFGFVGGMIVVAAGFFIYRRHQTKKSLREPVYRNDNGQQSTHSFRASGLPLRMSDSLHKQFASDFQNEGATSMMQQHELPPPSYKP